MIPIRFVNENLSPEEKAMLTPRRQTQFASGCDLASACKETIVIPPNERRIIETGITLAIPANLEGQVRTRSGLAAKHGVVVLNSPGTIDADYRGEVKVILMNLGNEPFSVTFGMRIAQIVFCPVSYVDLSEMATLSETERGTGGFGSTGILS